MCLLRPFLMQEESNAAYVQRQGFGKVLWNKGEEAQEILALLPGMRKGWPDRRQRMAVALRRAWIRSPPWTCFWEARLAAC